MCIRDSPYCDVDLTPKFDYDLEKAQRLNNCPAGASSKKKSGGGMSGGVFALIVILCVVGVAGLVAGLAFLVSKGPVGHARSCRRSRPASPLSLRLILTTPEKARRIVRAAAGARVAEDLSLIHI